MHKRPAACLITTGAAEKMVGVGISDAKFMNLPCLYLMPLSSQAASHHYPLQDVSSNGMNIVSQYKAELGEAVIVIDENCNLIKALSKIKRILDNHHPVVVFFRPEVLCRTSIKIKRFIKSSKESEDTPIVDKKINQNPGATPKENKNHIINFSDVLDRINCRSNPHRTCS